MLLLLIQTPTTLRQRPLVLFDCFYAVSAKSRHLPNIWKSRNISKLTSGALITGLQGVTLVEEETLLVVDGVVSDTKHGEVIAVEDTLEINKYFHYFYYFFSKQCM